MVAQPSPTLKDAVAAARRIRYMPALIVGSTFSYSTPAKRYRGTVVAIGGGYLVGAIAVVTTSRATGAQVDQNGPVSPTPIVLPITAVTALT